MEIHHQHHHDHPQHKEKLWKHYALEFFMLFLAVSAGFFAESLRENISDNHRAKQYIESFYEDLKVDTANAADIMKTDQNKIIKLANMSNCYDTVSKNIKA